MYEAVIRNDEYYDTLFLYAVKTTGIYCRPSCKSKAPKEENTEFFKTPDDAEKAGYRPCKRCKSNLLWYKPMQEMAERLKTLIEKGFAEPCVYSLEMDKIGLSRKRMAEVFKREYGVTPYEYVNELRYKEAKRRLEQTDDEIINVAYSVGFSSLSAFYKFFKERAQLSPAAYRKEFQK